jgi:transcriptional regulator of heat shock response
MTERQQNLLSAIIKQYVMTAEPVSSKHLEESGGFDVSSATLRNEMGELLKAGYLEQPHTSAGRVPTDKAYRYYVDRIVKGEEKAPNRAMNAISSSLRGADHKPRSINRAIADVLSELSGNLVITKLLDQGDAYKVGLKGLFSHPEFHEFDRTFHVTSFFEEFDQLFDQIEKAFFDDSNDESIRVIIGRENPFGDIQDETMIIAEYKLPDNAYGSMTLIGPTRMDYDRNLGLIQHTLNEINRLTEREYDE